MSRPPAHLLHIGPWAANIKWRAVPNMGLVPDVAYPAEPLLSIPPNISSMTFTLSRDDVSEATTEFSTSRGSAIIVEEMVTDLWWRRHDFDTGVTENIGRFQARDVQVSRDGDQIRTTTQWQNYRGVLQDRLVTTNDYSTPATAWKGGTTPVTDILKVIFPSNTLIDLSALDTTDLGTIGLPLQMALADTIPDVIKGIQAMSPQFDWDVELVGDAAVLKLWPGGRHADKGVVLIDEGSGWSPIKTWNRQTNGEDFASLVFVTGKLGTGLPAALDYSNIPQGERDYREDDQTLATIDLCSARAQQILNERSQIRTSWQIELMPGFWRGRSHIDLGDQVRIVVRLGKELLDEPFDVETISVEVDPAGIEKVTLTLGLPRPNPDPRAKRSTIGILINRIVSRM